MSNSKIVTTDLVRAGVSQAAIREIVQIVEQKIQQSPDVHQVYLTPAASVSDSCSHEKSPHNPAKCHVNGVAYKLGANARLDLLVTSSDFAASVAIYEVSSYGPRIDALLKTNPSQAAIDISTHFESKMPSIRRATSEMFISRRGKTAPSIFEGYEDDDLFDRTLYQKLKLSPIKIASKNGFVYIGRYWELDGRRSIPKIVVIVRSYDDVTSREIFNHIQEKQLTIQRMKMDEDVARLQQSARRNTEIHQGHIAWKIIVDILGWSTGEGVAFDTFGTNQTKTEYLNTGQRFNYNSINQYGQDFIYHDHCFSVIDVASKKMWPYLRSREDGISLVLPTPKGIRIRGLETYTEGRFLDGVLWESRLLALPMGPRKAMHRSDYSLSLPYPKESKIYSELDINPEKTSLSNQNIVWYGHGDKHYKLFSGKYDHTELNTMIRAVYKIDPSEYEIVSLETWLSDFSQEFSHFAHQTMDIQDIILLTDPSEPVIVNIDSGFYDTHFSALIRYAAHKKLVIGDVVRGQNKEQKQLLLDKSILSDYLTHKRS
jgi:hypothetical protein